MKYSEIRDDLKDGTIVFFDSMSWKAKFINLFTGGKVSHCGIVTWIRDSRNLPRLMLVESTLGGARLVNLSAYLGRGMTFVDVGLRWEDIESYTLDKTGHEHYSYMDFIRIGLKDILIRLGLAKLSTKTQNDVGEVCSEMVADILMRADFALPSTMLSPNDLLTYIDRYAVSVKYASE